MFDYKGQSVAELKELCDDKKHSSPYPLIYWTAEVYSIGKCLRDTTGYPDFLPLCIYTQHAPSNPTGDTIAKHEYNNDAYCLLVSSEGAKINGDKTSKKTVMYEYPIVTYRHKHNINQDENAKGTIVFPSHSIPGVEVTIDFDKLCEELNNLPDKYKPICICLHYHDINNNQHEEFIKRGFPVYTAGHPYDPDYIDKFYEILRHFKYSMSNHVGSYAFYSVEMGIPFSLIEGPVSYYNRSFELREKGELDIFKLYPELKEMVECFENKPRDIITPEQKLMTEETFALNKGIKGEELNSVLWKAFYKSFFTFKTLKGFFILLKRHPFFFLKKNSLAKFFGCMAYVK